MKAREFLVNFLNNSFVGDDDADFSDEFVQELISDEMVAGDFLDVMNEFAKLMCQKQKEICAEEAETKDLSGSHSYEAYYVIDKDSILNSPLPEELQDNEN